MLGQYTPILEKVNDLGGFSKKGREFGEENVPILYIYLRDAVIAAQANSGREKLHGCVFPDQAVTDLLVLTQVIVKVQILVTEFQVVSFSD